MSICAVDASVAVRSGDVVLVGEDVLTVVGVDEGSATRQRQADLDHSRGEVTHLDPTTHAVPVHKLPHEGEVVS